MAHVTGTNSLVVVLLQAILVLGCVQYVNGAVPVFVNPVNLAEIPIDESTGIGTEILTGIDATDTDSGLITYTLDAQNPPTPVKFDVSGTSIVTTDTFDYEDAGDRTYTLTIRATTDSTGDSTVQVNVIINNVNDNPPVLSDTIYFGTLEEGSGTATPVVRITATDADNDVMTYSITGGDDATPKFIFNGDLIETTATPSDYESLSGQNYKYTLTIEVTDTVHPVQASVIVTITNINESPPSWITFFPVYTTATDPYDIAEDAAIGDIIVTIAAADTDDGLAGQVEYSIGGINPSVSGLFHLDQVSGVLTTTGTLDRDTATGGRQFYDVTLIARDKGMPALSVDRTLRVEIIDVNDNAPVFTETIYFATSLAEGAPAATPVVRITATDADNDVMTYSITGGDDATPKFTLNGDLIETTATPTDYESLSGQNYKYTLTIEVTDKDTDNTAEASVIVTITNDNEAPPSWTTFIPPYVSATDAYDIAEDAAIGDVIVTIAATDTDDGLAGQVEYSIGGINPSVSGLFHLDQVSGVLTTTGTLDRDTATGGRQFYDVTLIARDKGMPALSVDRTLHVEIIDVNDNAPVVTETIYFATSLAEGAPAGTPVVRITATDADNDVMTYSITAGDDATPKFTFNGDLIETTATPTDYESLSGQNYKYTLTIQVTDTVHPVQASVIVTITNDNEAPPSWTTFIPPYVSATDAYDIAEDAAIGDVIVTIAAADTDDGLAGQVEYSIGGINPSVSGLFHLDQVSGVLTTTGTLDRDTATGGRQFYDVTLIARDKGMPALSVDRTLRVEIIDVNDNAPVVTETIYFATSLAEGAPAGTPVVRITATDADNDVMTYSITAGDDATPKFTFNGDLIETTATPTDYESLSGQNYKYTLTIQVTDTVHPVQASVIVTITNDNEAPPSWTTFIPPYVSATDAYDIAEDAAIGDVIVTIAATDTDDGLAGQVEYSIGGINPSVSGLFHLDKVSGVLTTTGTLDRDTATGGRQFYDVTLIARDKGTSALSVDRTLRVEITDVNDNAPVFGQNVYTRQFTEITAPGFSILTLTATDKDEAPSLTYAIHTSSTPASYSSKFSLDENTGDLTLQAVIDLDAGDDVTYNLVVTAVDDGSRVSTSTVVVTVLPANEYAPVLSDDTALVNEDGSIGDVVKSMVASDADLQSGSDADLRYSITDGDTDNKFIIDPSTCDVKLKDHLDYETSSTYNLTIHVTDSGTPEKTVTAVLAVTIVDISDEAPTCSINSLSKTINEDQTVPYLVTTLSCSDADVVDTKTYDIISGDDQNKFNIDADGKLNLVLGLDYDNGETHFSLVVQYSDGSTNLEVPVIIGVNPVNEHPPTFASDVTIPVPESEAVGASLVTFTATDDDAFPHGIVKYEIKSVSNNGNGLFSIDRTSGDIKLAQALDYEDQTSYAITIQAEDGGSPTPSVGTGVVTIQVSDVNDVTPSCTSSLYREQVQENTNINVAVLSDFGCTDADSTSLTYTIVNQSPDAHFEIADAAQPVLTLKSLLDYETTTSYKIEIKVSDGQLSTTVNVDIAVIDVNEGGPTFQSTPYTQDVQEDANIGAVVLTVQATDPDSSTSPYGQIKYLITGGNLENKFVLDADSGAILVAGVLNADGATPYTLTVVARELSEDNQATETVTITVTDVNDNVPTCNSDMAFSKQLPENTAPSYVIFTLDCSDLDEDTLTYTLSSGDTAYFRINGTNLELRAPIDYDTVSDAEFDVTIDVSDTVNVIKVTGTVVVTGVNEHTPTFTQATYSVDKAEDLSPGLEIVTVTANDLDKGETVTYSWITATSDFTLDQVSGKILLVTTLDRENLDLYALEVEASDGTNVATATVAITITDVNDNAPIFLPNSYSEDVSETQPGGHTVTTVTATDEDLATGDKYGKISYSITNTDGAENKFTIETVSGSIRTVNALDYEDEVSYTLYIQAVDSDGAAGARSSTAVVTIQVNPDNEADPVFENTPYTVDFAENTVIGTKLITLTASDSDTGEDGVVYFSIATHAHFHLDANSGEIYLQSEFDYETDKVFVFQATVHDSGTSERTSVVDVTINVLDVNDNTPSCSPELLTETYAEDLAAGEVIATLTCTDADDSSPNNALNYNLISVNGGTDTTLFDLSTSGVVTLAAGRKFNYEDTIIYNILIRASDQGTSSLSTTVTVRVEITDVNEAAPVFPGNPTFSIAETTASGSSIYTVTATDADTHQNLTYSFNPEVPEFSINSVTGVISLVIKQDYDLLAVKTFQLTIEAVDNGVIPQTGQATVQITITDEDDTLPIFTPAVYYIPVPEDTGVTDSILTVTAVDSDSTLLTYALVDDFSIFQIDGDVIKLQAAVDFEVTKSYILVVTVTDPESHVASANVHVTIQGVNDNAPSFTPSSASGISISESSAVGDPIIDLAADDADDGPDGDLTFSILTEPAGYENYLGIDPVSGVVTIAKHFDREAMANEQLTFVFQVADGGNTPQTDTYTLTLTIDDVNDKTPECTSTLYSVSVSEDGTAGGAALVTPVCNDNDANATNNVLTYTFVTGSDGDGNFDVVPTTGVVTVATGSSLNRETVTSYKLLVEVADSGAPTLSTTMTIDVLVTDVNDNAPVFVQAAYTFSVSEDETVGNGVGTVAATDADIGLAGSIVFSIASGNIDSNLAIDANTGEIKITGALDFEKEEKYTLTLHATDKQAAQLTGTVTVTINVDDVNDVAPNCPEAVLTYSIREDTAPSHTIDTISCPGGDGTLSYVIATVDGATTTTPFSIDPNTGEFKLDTVLDYENDQQKIVVIQAMGGAGLSDTVTVYITVIDVNEHAPVFTAAPYTANLDETSSIHDPVYIVSATDLDTEDQLTYSIDPASPVFDIDSTTGQVILTGNLNFEDKEEYILTVHVTDDGWPANKVATTTLTITLVDINDGQPVFTPAGYWTSINENYTVGTLVTTVTATDTDASTNIDYSILTGNIDGVFRVESSGQVVIDSIANLDYDSATKSYTLVVQATDGSNSATATVAIVVENYNDNSPSFGTDTSSQVPVAEDTAADHVVVTVAATDADHGEDGTLRYSIATGNEDGRFSIDPVLGVVTLVGELDIEQKASYIVTITATDAGISPGPLTAEYVLTVEVTDVNDVAPVCTNSLYAVSVAEDTPPTTSVAQVTCSDADKTANNNQINTYSLENGNKNGDFAISSTGEVSIANDLDAETDVTYILEVKVVDNGTPSLSTTTTVIVTVTDVNDNTPTFDSDPYHAEILESVAAGSNLKSVAAIDLDSGPAGNISYKLSNNFGGRFEIDGKVGIIKLVTSLDFEDTAADNPYVLEILAIDNDPTTPRTGTTTLSLTVMDANDNAPSCTPALVSVQVPENFPGSDMVVSLTCDDGDSFLNAALLYEVVSVNGDPTSTLFEVDASGVVTTAAATTLDYETVSSYTVLVQVSDQGTTALSFTTSVHIDVTDVNEHPPIFQSTPYTDNIGEGTAVGDHVYTVTATDQDLADTVTYSISQNDYFQINPTEPGNIYLIAPIDYDSLVSKVIAVTVKATDGTKSATEQIAFTVTDVNDVVPVFNPGVYSVSLEENATVSTLVTTVTVTDADDATLTLSFASGHEDNCFSINDNGEILLSNLAKFDYDTHAQSYVLVVRAVDGASNTATATVAVHVTSVNEDPPILTTTSNTVTIDENSPLGSSIDDVVATDADKGEDGAISYTISSVTDNADDKFTVDPTSGRVSLAGSLDRETLDSYIVIVTAADSGVVPGALTATYTLTVSVDDVNDVAPVCTQSVYVATVNENTVNGVDVTTIDCSDGDATSPNSDIEYTIVTGINTPTEFSIDASTGVVSVADILDREGVYSYTLQVAAEDQGLPPFTTLVTLHITVNDRNDIAPVFQPDTYTVNWAEDTDLGTSLAQYVATDGDLDPQLVYSIESGDVDSKFTIDPTNGILSLTDWLDFEATTINPYTLIVVVSDTDTVGDHTATATVLFMVTDTNDNSPVCSLSAANPVPLPEDTAVSPNTLVQVVCTDEDATVNQDLTYAITSITNSQGVEQTAPPVGIDTSGAIRLLLLVDYELDPSLTVLVEVSDGGNPSLTATTTVVFALENANEYAPVFDKDPYTSNLAEDAALGGIIAVAATDADVDDTITYELKDVSDLFHVDGGSGMVSLVRQGLDYETTRSYELVIVASDGNGLSASTTLLISITNANDEIPVFDPSTYFVSVSETQPTGVTIETLYVADSDDTTFTYDIAGNGDNIFSILGNTNITVLTIADDAKLDFESSTNHVLEITVRDGANNAGTGRVDIQVTPVNEHAPIFPLPSSTVPVDEDSPTDFLVIDLEATDDDDGADGEITYTIVSVSLGKFAIDPSTGEVTVIGTLDVETTPEYTVVIDAVDGGTTPSALSSQYTLTVTIGDVNDMTPYCTRSLYSASVAEGTYTSGTFVAQMTCSDADKESPNNDIVNYEITGVNPGDIFLISATGEVTTAAIQLDRETLDNYELTIEVTDGGVNPAPLTTTTTLTISITDVNDNDPTFDINTYNFDVTEDATLYKFVGDVRATDADIGKAGDIVYDIFAGNDEGRFGLDRTFGNINVTNLLDYEKTKNYVLTVHAVDNEAAFRTGTATVSITVSDVNDIAPVCTSSLYSGTIPENATPGTEVTTVHCTDGDDSANHNTVTYSITSGHTEFAIHPNTGVVATVNTALDVENVASYDVIVQATDGTHNTDVKVTVTITNINDETPVFSPVGPYAVAILENVAKGSTVFDVNATDADLSDTTFVFSITSGDDGKFVIGTTSGIIQTLKAIDRDDPLVPSYTLGIQVADGAGADALTVATSIVITIDDVNDNYPVCDAYTYTTTVPESEALNAVVITPTCNDLDIVASPNLAFSKASGDDGGIFLLDPGTGELTLQNALDYETETSYTLLVTVDDQGTSSLITTVTMTIYVDPVNEAAPEFTGLPYDTALDEDEPHGYAVVTISATDTDTGSTHGDVRYAITNGNDQGKFSIHPTTGAVTVSGQLDRENKEEFTLTVTASDMINGDADARSNQTTFTISINDMNDNYPVIDPASYALQLNENVSIGASVVQISASDDDKDLAGTDGLEYSIIGDNPGNVFTMVDNWVTLAGNVDATNIPIYTLTVKVKDQGSPILSALTLVTIQIVAVNEHAPTFVSTQDAITLSESETIGNSIYQAAGSDDDTGEFAVLRYYLRSGDTNGDFTMDLFNGSLRVANALDYDNPPDVYSLEIEVEDTETPTPDTRTATMTVAVTLTDFNDETPIFTSNTYPVAMDENTPPSSSAIVTVTAQDADTAGNNGVVKYSIVTGTGAAKFSIDEDTGVITNSGDINYEDMTLYNLVVQAIDGGTPALSSTCLVTISIIDLNDNTPEFPVGDVAISVEENTAVGTIVATAQASDADSAINNNNVIKYSFNTSSTVFQIGLDDGEITVMGTLDREEQASHTLVVLATDQGAAIQNTGSMTYTIVVTDINDQPPVISGQPYDTTVPEDEAMNTIIFHINASDADVNENADLVYNITNGNIDDVFLIDSGSGLIQIRTRLDRETTDVYLLEVTVVDRGATPLSAVITATVTVLDVNDNAPIFQPSDTYNFNIAENVPVNTRVGTVLANDSDTGLNGVVAYSTAYYIHGNNGHFVIDTSDGNIKTAGNLDRELEDSYIFIIRANDAGAPSLSATATVSITVTDVNDNQPFFSKPLYTGTVTENVAPGSSILTVVISDIDINVNDDIILTINDPVADFYIIPDHATFILNVKTRIDRETIDFFNFTLTGTDGGNPPLSITTQVQITVIDANDNAPVFAPNFYNNEIAYNDMCQVTIATLTASDADSGVNEDITYSLSQNSHPHLFTLEAKTGDIKKIATAVVDTGYKMYAAATDGGDPSQSAATDALIRVDTYNPDVVLLNYYLSISKDQYLVLEDQFLAQLTTLFQLTHTTSQAKRYCITTLSAESMVVSVYVIADDTADEASELHNAKQFLSSDIAYDIVAKDEQGTPDDALTGISWTSFRIDRIEKYVTPEVTTETTPWLESTGGIVTMVVLGVILVVLIVLVIVYVCYRQKRKRKVGTKMRAQELGEHGDKVPRDMYHNATIRTTSGLDFTDYDKKHPPPTVLSLPMPYATKKVPMFSGSRKAQDSSRVEVDLYGDMSGGPTLIKQPEKLRSESPVPAEPAQAPRRLPPINLHNPNNNTTAPPPYKAIDRPLHPFSSAQISPADSYNQDDVHIQSVSKANMADNRDQYDGRAVDPASGRLYEYNTRTNERRWIMTPSGQEVKLKQDH